MRSNIRGKMFVISIALVVTLSFTIMLSQSSANTDKKMIDGGNGIIPLTAPHFIGMAYAIEATGGNAFPENEAGISAYTDVGRTIDLKYARDAFRTIEYETDEYIIGSVSLPGYPETDDVHAYVHKDGWVVTYYLKEEPAAKIIDWVDYDTDEDMTGTKLEDGIIIVCDSAGVPTGDIKYYDFRHPNANKLMIVADALWNSGEDTFRLKLPSDFVFYERSYSHCSKGNDYTSGMYLDEKEISVIVPGTNYDLLSPAQLSLDVFHTIKITATARSDHRYYSYPAFGAIVLIYQEA